MLAFFVRDFRDLALGVAGREARRASGTSAVELDVDDAGDALELQDRLGVGLDRRVLAQPDVDLHEASDSPDRAPWP